MEMSALLQVRQLDREAVSRSGRWLHRGQHKSRRSNQWDTETSLGLLIHNFRPAPAELSARLLQRADYLTRFTVTSWGGEGGSFSADPDAVFGHEYVEYGY